MSGNDNKIQVAIEAAKSAPAVAGAAAAGFTLNDWIAIATGLYIAIQAAYLIRKWYREEHHHGGWMHDENTE